MTIIYTIKYNNKEYDLSIKQLQALNNKGIKYDIIARHEVDPQDYNSIAIKDND